MIWTKMFDLKTFRVLYKKAFMLKPKFAARYHTENQKSRTAGVASETTHIPLKFRLSIGWHSVWGEQTHKGIR